MTGARAGAGLLVFSGARVLLQLRSRRVDHPLTWSIPGGSVRPGEDPVMAALREAHEECGIDVDFIEFEDEYVADTGGVMFTTVIARATTKITTVTTWESIEHRWVRIDRVAGMARLHPDFRDSWGELRKQLSTIGATA